MIEASKPIQRFVSVLMATVLALGGLYTLRPRHETRFDQLALGSENTALFGTVQGLQIHCGTSPPIDNCLTNVGQNDPLVLWIGNSQLHAINQYQPGQEVAPALLFRKVDDRHVQVRTVSFPNLNLQELYVVYEYVASRQAPAVLLLSLVFDDLREEGLRSEIAALLLADQSIRVNLERMDFGRSILSRNSFAGSVTKETELEDPDLAGLRLTVQENAERTLTTWLSAHSELWRARPQLRGHFFNYLYQLRNTLLGISATTKRRLIPGRYRENLRALRATLEAARSHKTQVLLYIAPIRNDIAGPNIESEYTTFKAEAAALASEHSATLINLENLVPGSHWGSKETTNLGGKLELDFMHFQASGHEILASQLARELKTNMLQ